MDKRTSAQIKKYVPFQFIIHKVELGTCKLNFITKSLCEETEKQKGYFYLENTEEINK